MVGVLLLGLLSSCGTGQLQHQTPSTKRMDRASRECRIHPKSGQGRDRR